MRQLVNEYDHCLCKLIHCVNECRELNYFSKKLTPADVFDMVGSSDGNAIELINEYAEMECRFTLVLMTYQSIIGVFDNDLSFLGSYDAAISNE